MNLEAQKLEAKSKLRQEKFGFEIGDLVQVHRPLYKKEREAYPSWTSGMDILDRQCGRIISISSFTCVVEISGSNSQIHPCRYAIKWISYKLKIGDIVHVIKPDADDDFIYNWMDGMDVNTQGVIEHVFGDGFVEVKFPEIVDPYIYHVTWLNHVTWLKPKSPQIEPLETETVEAGAMGHKFDVGQEVKVHRPKESSERRSGPTWTKEMDEFDGVVGEILKINDDGYFVVKFPFLGKSGKNTWHFKEEWMSAFEYQEPKPELSEQAKEDLAHEKECGLLINFKNGDLPLYQQLVFEFSGSLEIREHAFNYAGELLEGYKSCHWSKPKSDRTDEKKKKIIHRRKQIIQRA